MERVRKSNERSASLRADGNQLYSKKDFYNALIKYNESLCHADIGSENLGHAYANRSAVYFEMKLYDECQRNIELAKQNFYPEENFEILNKRREKCVEMMKQQKPDMKVDKKNFFKLSYPPHKKLPFIAECLELKSDVKFGRHILTNRTLKTGDVIAIEKPFCKIIQEKFIFQKCIACFKDNLLDLLPCGGCQKAMFCSSCLISVSKNFHVYECPAMEVIFSSPLTPTMKMALRSFFIALTLFNGSIDDLEKFLKEDRHPLAVFEFKDSLDCLDKQQKFAATSSLISSDSEVNVDIFETIFSSSENLKTMWTSHSQFIKNFLKKQTQIGRMNYHEIYSWPLTKSGLADEELDQFKGALACTKNVVPMGNGSFPFIALINHSCSPNVDRIFIDDKLVLIVIKSIAKGEQLFDNYGYNFTNMPRDHRISQLRMQYKFKCSCKACGNDWPLLPALKIADKSAFNRAKKACRELSMSGTSQKKAFEKYRELCECIERGQKTFPSLEVCSMMQSSTAYLEMCLRPSIQFP